MLARCRPFSQIAPVWRFGHLPEAGAAAREDGSRVMKECQVSTRGHGQIDPVSRLQGWSKVALPALVCVALAGCGPIGGFGSGPGPNASANLSAPTTPVDSQPLPGSASGDQIGSGPVRLALIVPLTQGGKPSVVGTSLRNAAELAIADSGSNDVTLLVKDDQSSPEGARNAATTALSEGAEAIVGPLFANNVREVGRIARAANKPVIGFSTDTSVAARGVYLLSFLVETYVDRIVDFSASRGKESFAALVPNSDYGRVAEAEFQAAVARNGGRVMAVEHYQPGAAGPAAQKIAGLAGQIDALFIPEQAEAMGSVAQALTAAGLDSKRVQILGTGVWNDARVLKLPALQGAWFAAPDNAGFNAFAGRYRAKYNEDPTRIATLAYDAVSLAAALARQQGSQRYAESVLTNPAGFNGADGVFRFRNDGQNERGLSVLMIGNGSTSVVNASPSRLAGGSGT
jgi:ABC-type branched-subunit amino acid transport system substrate-binding protein